MQIFTITLLARSIYFSLYIIRGKVISASNCHCKGLIREGVWFMEGVWVNMLYLSHYHIALTLGKNMMFPN